MQGDVLTESACDESASVLINQAVFRVHDELSPTILASMVLLPRVYMAIFLEVLGSTRWTRVSHDHSALAASHISVDGSGQPYHTITSRALPL